VPASQNLVQRIVTGVLLIALCGFVLWQGSLVFTIFCGLILALGLSEFRRLSIKTPFSPAGKFLLFVIGSLYLGFGLLQFTILRSLYDGVVIVGFLVLVIIFCDIGGYIFGKVFGGPLLAPVVSPGKTWTGLAGCCIMPSAGFALFLALGFDHMLGPVFPDLWRGIGVIVALCVVAQAGDLLESWVKRQANAKDSGQVLPGHGGILDRIDGHISSVYLFHILISNNVIFGSLS
ncbi:MAG: phosphatidate cytidylyltransferase, partial [Pseudomonadota bacterium]